VRGECERIFPLRSGVVKHLTAHLFIAVPPSSKYKRHVAFGRLWPLAALVVFSAEDL
jgi:hypothetical protein